MYLKQVRIYDADLIGDAPTAATDLSAEVGRGEYDGTISFTFPTTNLFGETLGEDVQLTAKVSSVLETVTATGTPGSRGSVKLKLDEGDNIVSVIVSIGEYAGPEATIKVHAGVVAPEAPGNIQGEVSEDLMSIHMTWDPVTKGVDDGYIIPEDIQYQVLEIKVTTEGQQTFEAVGAPTKETSFVYTAQPGSEQRTCQLTVLAFNSAGDCGQIERGIIKVIGTPYSLPYYEDFEPLGPTTNPWQICNPTAEYTAQWGFFWANGLNPDWGNNVILWSVDTEGKGLGLEGMPYISTLGIDAATIDLDVYVGNNIPKTTLLAKYYGCEDYVEVGKIKKETDADFKHVTFDLPQELMDRDWVALYIKTEFDNAEQIFALNSVDIQKTTGVKALSNSKQIVAGAGKVVIYGLEGMDIAIYSIDGKCIMTDKVCGDPAVYNLAKGIYVVKAGDQTAKISI